jgi:hypothetical protein
MLPVHPVLWIKRVTLREENELLLADTKTIKRKASGRMPFFIYYFNPSAGNGILYGSHRTG